VKHLIARYELPADLRGDGIYAVGRKRVEIRRANDRMAERRKTIAAPLVGRDEQYVERGRHLRGYFADSSRRLRLASSTRRRYFVSSMRRHHAAGTFSAEAQ